MEIAYSSDTTSKTFPFVSHIKLAQTKAEELSVDVEINFLFHFVL